MQRWFGLGVKQGAKMSDKEPEDTSKKKVIGLGIIFILGGSYGASQGALGWSILLLGIGILVYVPITGKS